LTWRIETAEEGFMGDTSRDPVDHARTSRRRVGEAIKDAAKVPGFVLIAAGVVALALSLVGFALGSVGLGVTAVIAALLAAGGGMAWLTAERRRVRQAERDRLRNNSAL
jgi:hypothetical protein